MTCVNFVLDHPESTLNRLELLGTLLENCLKSATSTFCLAPDTDYADFLDDFLWSERFLYLPHKHVTSTHQLATFPQVYIGTELSYSSGCRLIFNCTNQVLSEFLDESNIEYIEWITNDPSEKSHLRKIFKHYQSNKINPKLIRL